MATRAGRNAATDDRRLEMQHDTLNGITRTATPLRPLRILIEDPDLHLASCQGAPETTLGFEITVCTGPACDAEECPLVMDGSCPVGDVDVVVSALGGPWSRSVRAAWAETGICYADTTGLPAVNDDERLRHHLGAALHALAAAGSPRTRAAHGRKPSLRA